MGPNLSRAVVVTCVILLGSAVWCAAASDDRKEPPTPAAQKKIQADLHQMFGAEERNARTPAARSALARRYLQAGIDMNDDSAARYVLLDDARQHAATSGDAATAQKATERLTQEYRVDDIRLVLATFNKIPPAACAKSDQCLLFLECTLTKAEDAGQYDSADELATLIDNAARLHPGTLLAKEAQSLHTRMRDLSKAYASVSEAVRRASANSTDVKAAGEAGAFFCLDRGDWPRGLPLLAKGADRQLAPLAKSELSAGTDSEKLAAVADGWWDFASVSNGLRRRMARQHAAALYRVAYTGLHGLTRVKVDARLEELARESDSSLGFLPIGLTLYYSFEPDTIRRMGQQQAVADVAGKGKPALLENTTILQDGAVGACASFNGTTSSIECGQTPASMLTGAFSLSTFVRIHGLPDAPIIARDWWDPPKGYTLRLNQGRPDITVGTGQWNALVADSAIVPEVWHHLAATYDGSMLRLFVDGSPAGKMAVNSGIALAPTPLVLGNDPKDRARRLAGDVDEVMIFDRPLEPWEIRLLASRGPEVKWQ